LSFDQLKVKAAIPRFDPGAFADAGRAPEWTSYAPTEPGALARIFGGAGRYQKQLADAQEMFDSAVSAYREQEAARLTALAAAKTENERLAAAARADAARQNAEVDSWRSAVIAGDPEAVESFTRRVLDGSRYPSGFPRQYQVAYRPENRDIVVEFELPSRQVIPVARGYRYVKTRDAIDPIARPEIEVKQRYAIAQDRWVTGHSRQSI
jgi:restriction system protein